MSKCPYCQEEMEKGYIETDGRSGVKWEKEEKRKRSLISKIFSEDYIMLKGKGIIKFRVDAEYCEVCKKIIIDAK